ncbi:unnamed protein product, partial [Rotaria socialis]
AHTLSSSRALPGIVKVPQSRPVATVKPRQTHRPLITSLPLNQRQPQARITASVIVPTLALDSEPKMTW